MTWAAAIPGVLWGMVFGFWLCQLAYERRRPSLNDNIGKAVADMLQNGLAKLRFTPDCIISQSAEAKVNGRIIQLSVTVQNEHTNAVSWGEVE